MGSAFGLLAGGSLVFVLLPPFYPKTTPTAMKIADRFFIAAIILKCWQRQVLLLQ